MAEVRMMWKNIHTRYLRRDGSVICRNCGRSIAVGQRYVPRLRAHSKRRILYCLGCAMELNIILAKTPQSVGQLELRILAACPDISSGLCRKVDRSYGGSFTIILRMMVREGLLYESLEPPEAYTDRRKGRVKVYRATEKGLDLLKAFKGF